MPSEVPQAILDELVADSPDIQAKVKSIIPEARIGRLFKIAERIISTYGDGKEGESKKTGTLIAWAGSERIAVQLLQNLPGFTLKTRRLPHETGGEMGELDITINEAGSLWGGKDISPEQLGTALGTVLYLEGSGLPSAMSPGERWQIQQDMKLSMRHWIYELEKRRVGP